MHITWRRTLGMLVGGVIILIPLRVSARIFFPLRPPLEVRMSGVLQAFDKKDSHGLNTLTVTIGSQKRLFKVSRVDTTENPDPGMMLLSDIFPPKLHLVGSPDLLASLEQVQGKEKKVTLQGFLYIQDLNFYVGEVHVAEAAPQ